MIIKCLYFDKAMSCAELSELFDKSIPSIAKAVNELIEEGFVIEQGYAPDLDEAELLTVGKDPFLIAYRLVSVANRTIVSFETSAPAKQRANKKIPDVCAGFGLQCITMFELIDALDFTTNWTQPK